MIITPHILVGAAIGKLTGDYFWASFLALISHYLVDCIPHKEYPTKNLDSGRFDWKMAGDFTKLGFDFLPGFSIGVFLANGDLGYVLAGMFFSILPDIAMYLKIIFKFKLPQFLELIHTKTHFWSKNMPPLWFRIFSQLAISIIAIWILIS